MFKRKSFNSFNSNSKSKWLAIILTVLAGLAVYLSFSLLFSPASVVIAQNDIGEAALIEASDLEVIKVAKRDLQTGTYTQIDSLVGQVSLTPIFKGQQIIYKQLNQGVGVEAINPGEFKPHQTMITLSTQQALWPSHLKVGDLISIIAVYATEEIVQEMAVGRITKPSSSSMVKHLKNLQEAQASSPNDTTISFVTDIEGGKQVLLALKTSQMVYLMPRHADLGGVD